MGYFSRIFEGYLSSDLDSQILYFTRHFDLPSVELLTELNHQKLKRLYTAERARKSALVGPHRDDLILNVLDRNLVDIGSQGEVRSVLLALKLAELDLFQTQTGVQPVLLIDDFSSELDKTRRGFLLEYFKDSDLQIFVTSTEQLETTGRLFQIDQGKICVDS
jgi:DNA replication and repair protein RecF